MLTQHRAGMEMNISLKIERLRFDLQYRFEPYPDGKYGFSYSGHEGIVRHSLNVMLYETRAECVAGMAQSIGEQVMVALQPEEEE